MLRASGGDAQDAAAMPTGERGGGDDVLDGWDIEDFSNYSLYEFAAACVVCVMFKSSVYAW